MRLEKNAVAESLSRLNYECTLMKRILVRHFHLDSRADQSGRARAVHLGIVLLSAGKPPILI